MSFRKRNIALSSPKNREVRSDIAENYAAAEARPSALDGRLTISTGTRSLDFLLAGHAGLAVGTSLLIEETGTTDFAGVLLRYFAAEGIVQGQHVHVLGNDEAWGRDLPGLAVPTEEHLIQNSDAIESEDKMKIAWRYERLGEYANDRNLLPPPLAPPIGRSAGQTIFCHEFDLTKRLTLPSKPLFSCVTPEHGAKRNYRLLDPSQSPFKRYLKHLGSQIASNSPSTIHRVIVPDLLSPSIYPHVATVPCHVLQFLHSLRALTRKYPLQLVVMISLPTSLQHRTKGLTRWIEIMCDGVLEIAPFPSRPFQAPTTDPKVHLGQEEVPQGRLKAHRLPNFHEKGGGFVELHALRGDLAFTLSRRKGFVIKPFSLPPVDTGTGVDNTETEGTRGSITKVDLDF